MNHKEKNRIRAASFDDTYAIGINSGLADYKLACQINRKLSIDFSRQDDIIADGVTYSFYYYTAGENCLVYNLVLVKKEDKTLLDFSPRLDYLLIVRNCIMSQRIDAIVKSLREIEGVGYAFQLDVAKGKSVKQALEIIELQEIDLLEKIRVRNTLGYVRQELLRQKEASPWMESEASWR
jgi:hypothetical protein